MAFVRDGIVRSWGWGRVDSIASEALWDRAAFREWFYMALLNLIASIALRKSDYGRVCH